MSKYWICCLQVCAGILLSGVFSLAPNASFAQDEGMTFEHAQTRTAYARRQMESMRRELKDAEKREESALSEVNELKQRYERAQQEAESATEARQSAEEKFAQAREHWSEESARLKRIHENRNNPISDR